ncbi:hypothetical protein MFLO_06099 [Listeria floridensis FSL S10-1187]|uniref:ABC transporter permease n=1 Tax=Listeria floridensis FSL S10-1187 TaxID=1265817 RepID=A0ABP3AZ40_9LIST|nr:ABC transporter permease [Listeria floridensis]EUJ32839.1 hypothetical protein MFLO_06099 [Listeria floridensis FSL S10-1187]
MSLIKNEWQKLFLRKSSWIMQLVLVVIVFLMALLMFFVRTTAGDDEFSKPVAQGVTQYYDEAGQPISENEYNSLISTKEGSKLNLKSETLSPKDSVTVLKAQKEMTSGKQAKAELQKQIDYYQVYADQGKVPMKSDFAPSGADFLSSLGSGASIATILVVIVASTIVASEFSGGTIKLLLTRPYSRSQILASKLAICVFYALLTSVVLLLSAFAFSFMLGGDAYSLPVSASTGALNAYELAFQMLGTNLILMITFLSIAFLFSSVVRSQALAVGVGIGVLFSGNIIAAILPLAIEKYDWLKWLIFNLLNLNSLVSGSGIAGGLAMWQVILGLFVYVALILSLTFYIFKKRDVALS